VESSWAVLKQPLNGMFYGIFMGSSWDFHGIFLGWSWDFDVIFMGFSWDFHGI
jgi:hypothetical protein